MDEVNLLDDGLVDLVLDSAASGLNTVEREGVSIIHPAKFIMLGSGNPMVCPISISTSLNPLFPQSHALYRYHHAGVWQSYGATRSRISPPSNPMNHTPLAPLSPSSSHLRQHAHAVFTAVPQLQRQCTCSSTLAVACMSLFLNTLNMQSKPGQLNPMLTTRSGLRTAWLNCWARCLHSSSSGAGR